MTIKNFPATLLLFLAAFSTGLRAEAPGAKPLNSGKEYHITFDDGETIRNGKILSVTEKEYEIQIRGLTEKIKVERSTIVSAIPVPVADKAPEPPPQFFFSRWEIQALVDFHLGLAALTSFDSFFPAAGVGINTYLTNPIPYIRINAFHAEATFTQITDGERTINAINTILTPRISFSRIGIDWYAGAGGGIAALQLKSYSFNKTSYAWIGRVEIGGAYKIGKNFRVYAGVNGTYWQDSLELLLAVSLNLGVAYVF